jgi:hypothetical protein
MIATWFSLANIASGHKSLTLARLSFAKTGAGSSSESGTLKLRRERGSWAAPRSCAWRIPKC